jgi:type I restriction enzyme S subunit
MEETIQRIKGGMGVPHLFQEDLNKFYLPVPDTQEQFQIGKFLDHETAKIDVLIQEQQRLVELLKEKRQVVISHAVTKGIDPTVPMKDSGVDSIGQIPATWSASRVKSLSLKISKGTTPTTEGASFTWSGVRFLKAENISKNGVQLEPTYFISEEDHLHLSRSALQAGDILVVIAGATTGKSAVLDTSAVPANTNQAVSFIRLVDPRYSDFVNLWLSTPSIQQRILLASVQSAQPNLSMEDLGNLPLPLPPMPEVQRITAYCKAVLNRFEALQEFMAGAITLLQERRAALISAAVTGKIDVRDYTPRETPGSDEHSQPA